MKYIIILLILVGFFATTPSFAVPNDDPLDFAEFVGVNDTYVLGEEFEIRFEKMTIQPCLSYQISLMKDGLPESKITYSREPLCATTEPVEPYLFSDEFSRPEFFDVVGTYHVELKIDGTTLLKKIEIIDQPFSITQKQVRYVIPYEITGGFIEDMNLDCSSASLVLWISSYDSGTVHLDIPNSMLGGIFMVLVNDKEYEDISLDGNKLTINFTKDVDKIEIKGTYSLNSDITGVCDVIHDPPYSYILSPLKQFKSGVLADEIQCKENLILIQKHNGSPACVILYNTHKLFERGWINSSNISQFKEVFCELNDGKWSKEFHNCIGGSIQVSCDDIGASELKPPNVFGKIITQEGHCISHEKMCASMGGTSACMSYEQMGHGRDVCYAICEFEK